VSGQSHTLATLRPENDPGMLGGSQSWHEHGDKEKNPFIAHAEDWLQISHEKCSHVLKITPHLPKENNYLIWYQTASAVKIASLYNLRINEFRSLYTHHWSYHPIGYFITHAYETVSLYNLWMNQYKFLHGHNSWSYSHLNCYITSAVETAF